MILKQTRKYWANMYHLDARTFNKILVELGIKTGGNPLFPADIEKIQKRCGTWKEEEALRKAG